MHLKLGPLYGQSAVSFHETHRDTPPCLVSQQQGSTEGVGDRDPPRQVFRQLSPGVRILWFLGKAESGSGWEGLAWAAQRCHPDRS